MIEHVIECRSLPFIGCRSSTSKWIEDISRNLQPLKYIWTLESPYSFEDSIIYDIAYPFQRSLISDRFLEELYKKDISGKTRSTGELKGTETSFPEVILLKNGMLSPDSGRIAQQEAFLEKKLLKEKEGKTAGFTPQKKPKVDKNEIEKVIPEDSKIRNKLLEKIVYRWGEDIENLNMPGNMIGLKEVTKHLNGFKHRKIDKFSEKNQSLKIEGIFKSQKFLEEKLKGSNQSTFNFNRSFNIKSESYSKKLRDKEFSNFLSEGERNQFSKIMNISVSQKFLEEKLKGSNQSTFNFNRSFNIKSESNKEFSNFLSGKIKNQFLKLKHLSVSQEFLEEKSRIHPREVESALLKNYNEHQFFSKEAGRISSRHPIVELKKLEKIKESESSPSMLIEQAYSNYENKIIKEDERKLFLNIVEKMKQFITQSSKEAVASEQNIFNINISGDLTTGEKELRNLSDRLVLILKEQARRHGIDLS